MNFYKHIIPAQAYTQDKDHLESLYTREGLIKGLQSRMFGEHGKWAGAFKAAPYSDKDVMFMFSDEHFIPEQHSSLLSLDEGHVNELLQILDIYVAEISSMYAGDIQSGKKEILVGINTGMGPGKWSTQSVHRPHIHLTFPASSELLVRGVKENINNLVNNGELLKSNIMLKKIDFGEHEMHNNHFLNTYDTTLRVQYLCVQYLKSLGLDLQESSIFGIDIKLEKNMHVFSHNADLIKSVYKGIWDMLNHGFHNNTIPRQYVIPGGKEIPVDKSNLGFSCVFHYKEGDWFLRTKFFYRQSGYGSGVMEAMGHFLERDYTTEKTVIFDKEFKEKIFSIAQTI